MKFLLAALNAKYIHSNPALYSLRSYAIGHNPGAVESVEIAEYTINQRAPEILADIYKRKPDALAFSCYIWNWSMVEELLCELPKVMPGLPVWLGGPEVSFHSERIMDRYPCLSGIMIGEGEVTFSQLLDYYERYRTGKTGRELQMQIAAFWPGAVKQAGLHAISGLVFRDPVSGEVVRTPERPLTDISSLPFYYEDLSGFENRIIYYESSRGCPFQCSYCLSSIDKKVRLRSIALVKKELQFFLDRKVPQVKFADRTFNCIHSHCQEIWRYILEQDNGVTNFHFEVSAELLNGTELALLSRMRPGLVQLEIGVQSTNPETLQAIRRRMDLDRLRHVIVRLHSEHNVHIHLDLIAGLPYENLQSFRTSFNDVYAMRPQQLQLGFLKVLQGSYMEEMAASYGIVHTHKPPYEVLYTKWLSYEDVLLLKQVEEMVELYYNSGQFPHVLPTLEKSFQSPFDLFAALAAFYEKNGCFTKSPSRAYRYEVLLKFAIASDPDREELYRELMVYDLYLRENLKSRPSFAADLSGWHDRIAAFYKDEAENRRQLPEIEDIRAARRQRMTHIEPFVWPVYKPVRELLEQFDHRDESRPDSVSALLFDYRKIDPLTGNALTRPVTLEAGGRITGEKPSQEKSND